jgi:DNA (cytosine-5)-methyltransferase 1
VLDPAGFPGVELLIASPPCPTFSAAGKRGGQKVVDIIIGCAAEIMAGRDTRAERIEEARALLEPVALRQEEEKREPNPDRARARALREATMSILVVEPLRWTLALRPCYVALEQVPPVLPVWKAFAQALETLGYRTWSGLLSAERYGVPQTRERAFLMASLDGPVWPPAPTHQEYEPGIPACEQHTLEGVLQPWVSMAEALGWNGQVGFARRNDRDDGGEYRERDLRDADEPAFNLTEKARSWTRREIVSGNQKVEEVVDSGNTRGGTRESGRARSVDEPSAPLTTRADQMERRVVAVNTGRDWKKDGTRADAQTIPTDQPAPAIDGKGRWHKITERQPAGDPLALKGEDWPERRPATTVAGDPRVFQPGGHHGEGEQSEGAIRVSIEEAAVLQGFPRDYPWQGSKSKQFEQVGNAIPPPLARAVLSALLEHQ